MQWRLVSELVSIHLLKSYFFYFISNFIFQTKSFYLLIFITLSRVSQAKKGVQVKKWNPESLLRICKLVYFSLIIDLSRCRIEFHKNIFEIKYVFSQKWMNLLKMFSCLLMSEQKTQHLVLKTLHWYLEKLNLWKVSLISELLNFHAVNIQLILAVLMTKWRLERRDSNHSRRIPEGKLLYDLYVIISNIREKYKF